MATIILVNCFIQERTLSFWTSTGEPARPLSERKLKRSALRDVAGNDAIVPIRRLQRAVATGHAQRRRAIFGTLG